jgi:hypothetical protein
MHNPVTPHCHFGAPHNGHSVSHWQEEIGINKNID